MILIVDDKQENLFSLQSILESHGFGVETATSGDEALRKVLKQDYALIILDVQMPNMDGFEVAEAINGLNRTQDIPIIFLSAVNTHKKFVTRGLSAGAVDYLTKPVDADILMLKVRNFYRLHEKNLALKKAEENLRATLNGLHSTLESLPQIAFTTTAEGIVDFVNAHWYHYSPSIVDFPRSSMGVHFNEYWQANIASRKPFETQVELINRSGEHQFHLLRVVPVFVHNLLSKWVGTYTNIHQQIMLSELMEKRVAERTHELLEINRELEISNNDLQQFASVASHDLQEPLRKIQVFSNILGEQADLNPRLSDYLRKINVASKRMSSLITDLLNFSRLSIAGSFEPTNLNEVVREILTDLELMIKDHEAEIELGDLPHLETMPGLMHQLFLNLITNALKFTQPGKKPKIRIYADCVNQPDDAAEAVSDGAYARIHVQDEGIGFDQQYAEKIFTIFQRLHTKEQYEGTGIGLAIARKIVEKHKGMIKAKSSPGSGADFIIILPRQQADENRTSTVKSEQEA